MSFSSGFGNGLNNAMFQWGPGFVFSPFSSVAKSQLVWILGPQGFFSKTMHVAVVDSFSQRPAL